jgi:hypothetical protein
MPLLKRRGLSKEARILTQLLGTSAPVPAELLQIPPFRLLQLLARAHRTLQRGDYRRLFRYAQQQKLCGLLHRWIVFFPGAIIRQLERGSCKELPRAILQFPVFNQHISVYSIGFLGNFVFSKNQRHLRTKPSPKEEAFIIHLALRAGSPHKSILIKDLYHNFWPRSKDPHDLLLHLVANIKKKLKIPSHLLAVSSAYAEPRLVNRGLYMTTDYAMLETLLAQCTSLERAGEWVYAKRDYLRAFALVRGEPFRKMYDPWSESMRASILSTVEDKSIHFANNCQSNKEKDTGRKILEKVSSIMPNAREVNVVLKKTRKSQ